MHTCTCGFFQSSGLPLIVDRIAPNGYVFNIQTKDANVLHVALEKCLKKRDAY